MPTTRFAGNETIVVLDNAATEIVSDPVMTPGDVERGVAVFTVHKWALEGGGGMDFEVFVDQSNDGSFYAPDAAAIFSIVGATAAPAAPVPFQVPADGAYTRLRFRCTPLMTGVGVVIFDVHVNWISNG